MKRIASGYASNSALKALVDGYEVYCVPCVNPDGTDYVWTRDTAYAVDLGLALLDPDRAMNSLDFKLSADKPAVGSGGTRVLYQTSPT